MSSSLRKEGWLLEQYLENVKRLRKFYQSSDFQQLKKADLKEKIESKEDELYRDPDTCDTDLHNDLVLKYNNLKWNGTCNLFANFDNKEIKMSADFI